MTKPSLPLTEKQAKEAQKRFAGLAKFVLGNVPGVDVNQMFHGGTHKFQTSFLDELEASPAFKAAIKRSKADPVVVLKKYKDLAASYNASLDQHIATVKTVFPKGAKISEKQLGVEEIDVDALEDKGVSEEVMEAAEAYNLASLMHDTVIRAEKLHKAAQVRLRFELLGKIGKSPVKAFNEEGFITEEFEQYLESNLEGLKKHPAFPKDLIKLNTKAIKGILNAQIEFYNGFIESEIEWQASLSALDRTAKGLDNPLANAFVAFVQGWQSVLDKIDYFPAPKEMPLGITYVPSEPKFEWPSLTNTTQMGTELAVFQTELSTVTQNLSRDFGAPIEYVGNFLASVYAAFPNDPLRFPMASAAPVGDLDAITRSLRDLDTESATEVGDLDVIKRSFGDLDAESATENGLDRERRNDPTTAATTTTRTGRGGATTTTASTTSTTTTTLTTTAGPVTFTQSSTAPTISTITNSTTTANPDGSTTTIITGTTSDGTTPVTTTITQSTTGSTTVTTTTPGGPTHTTVTTTQASTLSTTPAPTTVAPTSEIPVTTTVSVSSTSNNPSTSTTTVTSTSADGTTTFTTTFTQPTTASTLSTVSSTTTTTNLDGSTTTTIIGTSTTGAPTTTTVTQNGSTTTTEIATTSASGSISTITTTTTTTTTQGSTFSTTAAPTTLSEVSTTVATTSSSNSSTSTTTVTSTSADGVITTTTFTQPTTASTLSTVRSTTTTTNLDGSTTTTIIGTSTTGAPTITTVTENGSTTTVLVTTTSPDTGVSTTTTSTTTQGATLSTTTTTTAAPTSEIPVTTTVSTTSSSNSSITTTTITSTSADGTETTTIFTQPTTATTTLSTVSSTTTTTNLDGSTTTTIIGTSPTGAPTTATVTENGSTTTVLVTTTSPDTGVSTTTISTTTQGATLSTTTTTTAAPTSEIPVTTTVSATSSSNSSITTTTITSTTADGTETTTTFTQSSTTPTLSTVSSTTTTTNLDGSTTTTIIGTSTTGAPTTTTVTENGSTTTVLVTTTSPDTGVSTTTISTTTQGATLSTTTTTTAAPTTPSEVSTTVSTTSSSNSSITTTTITSTSADGTETTTIFTQPTTATTTLSTVSSTTTTTNADGSTTTTFGGISTTGAPTTTTVTQSTDGSTTVSTSSQGVTTVTTTMADGTTTTTTTGTSTEAPATPTEEPASSSSTVSSSSAENPDINGGDTPDENNRRGDIGIGIGAGVGAALILAAAIYALRKRRASAILPFEDEGFSYVDLVVKPEDNHDINPLISLNDSDEAIARFIEANAAEQLKGLPPTNRMFAAYGKAAKALTQIIASARKEVTIANILEKSGGAIDLAPKKLELILPLYLSNLIALYAMRDGLEKDPTPEWTKAASAEALFEAIAMEAAATQRYVGRAVGQKPTRLFDARTPGFGDTSALEGRAADEAVYEEMPGLGEFRDRSQTSADLRFFETFVKQTAARNLDGAKVKAAISSPTNPEVSYGEDRDLEMGFLGGNGNDNPTVFIARKLEPTAYKAAADQETDRILGLSRQRVAETAFDLSGARRQRIQPLFVDLNPAPARDATIVDGDSFVKQFLDTAIFNFNAKGDNTIDPAGIIPGANNLSLLDAAANLFNNNPDAPKTLKTNRTEIGRTFLDLDAGLKASLQAVIDAGALGDFNQYVSGQRDRELGVKWKIKGADLNAFKKELRDLAASLNPLYAESAKRVPTRPSLAAEDYVEPTALRPATLGEGHYSVVGENPYSVAREGLRAANPQGAAYATVGNPDGQPVYEDSATATRSDPFYAVAKVEPGDVVVDVGSLTDLDPAAAAAHARWGNAIARVVPAKGGAATHLKDIAGLVIVALAQHHEIENNFTKQSLIDYLYYQPRIMEHADLEQDTKMRRDRLMKQEGYSETAAEKLKTKMDDHQKEKNYAHTIANNFIIYQRDHATDVQAYAKRLLVEYSGANPQDTIEFPVRHPGGNSSFKISVSDYRNFLEGLANGVVIEIADPKAKPLFEVKRRDLVADIRHAQSMEDVSGAALSTAPQPRKAAGAAAMAQPQPAGRIARQEPARLPQVTLAALVSLLSRDIMQIVNNEGDVYKLPLAKAADAEFIGSLGKAGPKDFGAYLLKDDGAALEDNGAARSPIKVNKSLFNDKAVIKTGPELQERIEQQKSASASAATPSGGVTPKKATRAQQPLPVKGAVPTT